MMTNPNFTCANFVDVVTQYIDPSIVRMIVELGAHKMVQTLELAACFPNAQVIAFECAPKMLQECYRQSMLCDRVMVVPLSVAHRNGFVKFYVTDAYDGGASSVFRFNPKHPVVAAGNHAQVPITVPMVRLDNWCGLMGIKEIDILWMDIQGAESFALIGLGDMLSSIKAIHSEVLLQEYYNGQRPSYRTIDSFLRNKGFVQMYEEIYLSDALDTNVAYIHESLIKI